MKPKPGISLLAFACGLLIALLKVVGSFVGAGSFFGTDVLACSAVAIFTIRYPKAFRRWALLIGIPVFVPILLFVAVARVRGLDIRIGLWWSGSVLTTAIAVVVGSVLGCWLARRREQNRSGDGSSGESLSGFAGQAE